MIKPNEEIVKSLVNLQDNPNFEVFAKWIHDSWIDISVKNNRATGELMIKNQGRGLELNEILEHIERAPDYMDKFNEAKNIDKYRKIAGGIK